MFVVGGYHFVIAPEKTNYEDEDFYIILCFSKATCKKFFLILLHSELPKLHRVLAVVSAVG